MPRRGRNSPSSGRAEVDRGGAEFAKSMGTSLYGTVINNEIHEFIGDLKDLIFHKKQ